VRAATEIGKRLLVEMLMDHEHSTSRKRIRYGNTSPGMIEKTGKFSFPYGLWKRREIE